MTRPINWLFLLTLLIGGCSSAPREPGRDVVLLVPGVAGDGQSYDPLAESIRQATGATVTRISWGAPFPLFILNFSNRGIHNTAERKLAQRILDWQSRHPDGQIDLVGHSAGCGVILGAIARLPQNAQVRTVALLAPSVSPSYDLRPALVHIDGQLHVFFSEHDTLFLKWRTGHFGTYDNMKTSAAGNVGLVLDPLPIALQSKVTQHPYQSSWNTLANDGGHFGPLAKLFVQSVIAPLFAAPAPDASPPR